MQKRLWLTAVVGLILALAACTVWANDAWISVPYTDESVEYDGFWRVVDNPAALGGSELMGSRTLNSYVEFSFTGSGVRWLGTKSPAMGYASVYLNGELVATQVDGYSPDAQNQAVIYAIEDLKEGSYVLRIVPEEAKSEAAAMSFVAVNGFQYIPTLEDAIAIGTDAIDLPIGCLELHDPVGRYYPEQAVALLEVALENGRAKLNSNNPVEKLEAIGEINRRAAELKESVVVVNIPDQSGNGRVGTIEGGPVWIEGPIGRALAFNGAGDAVRVDNISVSDTSSIEFWLQMPEAVSGGWQNILGVRGANTDRSPGIWHQGDGDFQTIQLSTQPNWKGFNHMGPEGEGTKFDPDQWYHIALVKNGAYYTLYVNAEEIITVETGEGMIPGEYLLLGGRNVNIDDLRVWDRVRDQVEIAADYQEPLVGNEEGLIGYWTFDTVR